MTRLAGLARSRGVWGGGAGWTRERRRVALLGGLLFIGLVNLLDLAGVLGLALSNAQVRMAGTAWTVCVVLSAEFDESVGDDFEALAGECWTHARTTGVAFVVVVVGGALVLGALYPDAGTHFVFYATWPGMAVQAIGNAVLGSCVLLMPSTALFFLLTWWKLRQTTPEERVLDDTDSR